MPESVSVLICTRNGAGRIGRVLASLGSCRLEQGLSFEVVVVDNCSTDGTKAEIEKYSKVLPLQYIFEARPGHSIALNRGVAGCKGDLILFTDDDAEVMPDWILAYVEATRENSAAGFFYGVISPVFSKMPPDWWFKIAPRSLAGRDCGSRPLLHDTPCKDADMVGVNCAMRRTIAQQFPFSTKLGNSSVGIYLGADTELSRRIIKAGYKACYVPGAAVRHFVDPRRVSLLHLLRRKVVTGRASVYFEDLPGQFSCLGACRDFAWNMCLSMICLLKRSNVAAIEHSLKAARVFGQLREILVIRLLGKGAI